MACAKLSFHLSVTGACLTTIGLIIQVIGFMQNSLWGTFGLVFTGVGFGIFAANWAWKHKVKP